MPTTYPTTPSTLTLTSAFAGAQLRDYRDSGFVQSTAVVRDANKTKSGADYGRRVRIVDFKTAKFLGTDGSAGTLASGDTVQALPLSADEVITGGVIHVVRAASAGDTNTITLKVGATALSSAISCLAAGSTAFATNVPLAISADDTLDFLLTGTNSPVFDGKVEVELFVQTAR